MARKRKLRKERDSKERSMSKPTYGLSKRLKRMLQLHPWFKRGAQGLYGGKFIRFGNRISEFRNKSRRSWKPNVQRKRFWSETYNRFLSFKCTTTVIKQVKKLHHGIDQYLMRTHPIVLRYKQAKRMRKNLIRIHKCRRNNFLVPPESPAELESFMAKLGPAYAVEGAELPYRPYWKCITGPDGDAPVPSKGHRTPERGSLLGDARARERAAQEAAFDYGLLQGYGDEYDDEDGEAAEAADAAEVEGSSRRRDQFA